MGSSKQLRSKILIPLERIVLLGNRAPVGRIIEQGYIDKITGNMDYMEDTGKYRR